MKVAVIGAGIAGLSAGCYAAMNGYDVDVFEMHDKPGGMCTAWTRAGYTFDGCLHWLTGSDAGDTFHKLWRELGAVQGRRMIHHDVFYRFTGRDGRSFSVYTNVDRLEAHMLELSPADREPIAVLCGLIRRLVGFGMPMDKAFELYGPLDFARMMLRMGKYLKDVSFCSGISLGAFAERFSDPLLREAIAAIFFVPETSLLSLVITLALLHKRAGGFPEGGSLPFARAIERRLLDLGGELHYRARVAKIIVRDGAAAGVRLADGTEVPADRVISAADLRTTLYEMLDGSFLDPHHVELLQNGRLFPSSVQVSFGVNRDMGHAIAGIGEMYHPVTPLVVGREKPEWIVVKGYDFDPTLAPRGKSVVMGFIPTSDYDYWRKLRADRGAYRAEKARVASAVTDELERRFTGFKGCIEVTDVATPETYVRYTGSWKGTYMSWVQTPAGANALRSIKKTVPGLANFWLAGMWVMAPGGVPTGAKTGRDVVEIMCRQDRRRFHAEEPS